MEASIREGVIDIARAAGAAIMEIYRQDFTVEHKDDRSPLTQADLAAHRVIVAGLEKLTPDLPVLSEESASLPWGERQGWRRYWLVDPLKRTCEVFRLAGAGFEAVPADDSSRIRSEVLPGFWIDVEWLWMEEPDMWIAFEAWGLI